MLNVQCTQSRGSRRLMAEISLIALEFRALASITIRNLEGALKPKLRVRAARHGRSMEDEARLISPVRRQKNRTRCLTCSKRSAVGLPSWRRGLGDSAARTHARAA